MGIVSTIIGVVVLLFGGLCVFAAGIGVWSAFKYRSLSITDGRDIQAGELTGVKGTIVDWGGLTSPFTGQDCVGHKWIVERRTSSPDRGREWEVKHVRGDLQEFSVRTPDGTPVTVKPPADIAPRSDLQVGTNVIEHLKPGETPPERFRKLMDDGIIDEQDSSIGSSLDEEFGYEDHPLGTRRYRERTLTEGDDIYVYGEADVVGSGVEISDDGAVFAVSGSTDEEIAETQTGRAIILFIAGLTAILFGVGFLL